MNVILNELILTNKKDCYFVLKINQKPLIKIFGLGKLDINKRVIV